MYFVCVYIGYNVHADSANTGSHNARLANALWDQLSHVFPLYQATRTRHVVKSAVCMCVCLSNLSETIENNALLRLRILCVCAFRVPNTVDMYLLPAPPKSYSHSNARVLHTCRNIVTGGQTYGHGNARA